jgi:hypothetical protein
LNFSHIPKFRILGVTKIHVPELEDPRLLPFNVNVASVAGGGTPHGRYGLFSIKYYQFITLKFIVGLLWATGL